MAEVISFVNYRPPARFDSLSWTQARVEEATTRYGTYTPIDTIALTPDADPANPAARSFTTENGTAINYWYSVVFVDADGDTSQPTSPVQNVAGSVTVPTVTTGELFRVMGVSPTAEQTAAGQRCINAAVSEIRDYLARVDPLDPYGQALVDEATLERAVEHWKQGQAPFGVLPFGGEIPIVLAQDTFQRTAMKIKFLRQGWGLA